MPKEYLCNKIINGKFCGETNPDNFPKGRYSVCKKCKNKEMSEIRQKKKEENDKEKVKKIDPQLDFKKLIENQPVFHKGRSVANTMRFLNSRIIQLEFELIDMRNKYNKIITNMIGDIEMLKLRVPHK
jgi:hypothetical protein